VLRQIGGWFLVVAGVLVILAGVIAIAASYDPSTPDAGSTRLGGWIFIGFGLVLAMPGILLIRSGRRIARAAPKQPGPAGRFTRLHLVGYSAAVLLGAAFGVGAIIYSFSLDGEVQSFRSSHRCTTAPDANCYQLRNVVITGVDVSHGQSGEMDTVDFMDSGSLREVAIHPRGLDSSVLRAGVQGVATLWHGKYTNIDVADESFATTDNPVGQREEWRLIGITVLGVVALQAAIFTGGFLYLRRRKASRAVLPPRSAVETTGYPILPLVLHPSLPKSRSLVWFVALPIALVFEFFYFAQYGSVVQWTIGAASTLLLAWGAIWQLVLVPRSAIYVDDLSFGKVSGFGRRKSWDRSEAARVVLRSLDRGRRMPALPAAFIVGPDGRARMRFSAALYDEDSYTRFAAALRVPLNADAVAVPIAPAQLEREIPGSTSWAARHATALGAGMAIVGGAVILLILELSSGPSHR
jgi:hypothetical protein